MQDTQAFSSLAPETEECHDNCVAFVYFNWSLALPAGSMPSNALHDFSILFAPLASYFLESAIIRIYWIVFTARPLRALAQPGPVVF